MQYYFFCSWEYLSVWNGVLTDIEVIGNAVYSCIQSKNNKWTRTMGDILALLKSMWVLQLNQWGQDFTPYLLYLTYSDTNETVMETVRRICWSTKWHTSHCIQLPVYICCCSPWQTYYKLFLNHFDTGPSCSPSAHQCYYQLWCHMWRVDRDRRKLSKANIALLWCMWRRKCWAWFIQPPLKKRLKYLNNFQHFSMEH